MTSTQIIARAAEIDDQNRRMCGLVVAAGIAVLSTIGLFAVWAC